MILPDINLLIHAHNVRVAQHQKAINWWNGPLQGNDVAALALPSVPIYGHEESRGLGKCQCFLKRGDDRFDWLKSAGDAQQVSRDPAAFRPLQFVIVG